MATEVGKLIAIFEGDTSKFDAASRRVETRLKAVKATAVSETRSIQDQFGISSAIIRKTADDFDKVGVQAKSGLGAAEQAISKATAKLTPLTQEQVRFRSELAKTVQAERASATGSIVAAVAEREVAAQAKRLRAVTEVAKIKGQTTRDSLRNDILIQESQKAVARALDVTAKTNVKTAQVAAQSSKQMVAANASVSASFATVGGGIAIATAAIGAAVAGILTLSTYSTRLAADVFDLSQKTNFSAETLSSLKVAAELSGGSFESLATALGIFDRNMEEARQGGTDMSRVFKVLKIDVNDNELALRQTFQVLTSVKQGSTQTALAMRLFGRSGKEVLGIIKETNGNIDSFIEKMREAGFVITSEGAKKADQFQDKLTLVRNKLEAIARQITGELIPVVSQAADDVSDWLNRNQGELRRTAKEIAAVIGELYTLAKVVAAPFIVEVIVTRKFVDIGKDVAPWIAPTLIPKIMGGPMTGGPYKTKGPAALPWEQGEFAIPGSIPAEAKPIDLDALLRPKRGGGGGKAARDILEGLKNQIIDLNAETRKLNVAFLESANQSALAAGKEDILKDVMKSLSTETQMAISKIKDVDEAIGVAISKLPAKSRAAAKALVEQAKATLQSNLEADNATKAQKALSEAATKLREELHQTRLGTDSYSTSIDELEKTLQSLGVSSDPLIQGQVKEIQQLVTALRTLNKERERLTVSLQTRPRLATTEAMFAQEMANITRPRIATVEEQVTRERIAIIRDQMQQVAFDITAALDRALYDGISGGAKRGIQSLTMSLLDMIQQVILGRLKNALAEALSGAATGGGGGGFLSGLFQSILGSLFGIGVGKAINLGGGATFTPGGTGTTRPRIVGRQSGGDVWPGQLYQVHKDEVIAPTMPGHVFNKAQQQMMRGVTIINNFHFPPDRSNTSRAQKMSQRQQAEMIMGMMETQLR